MNPDRGTATLEIAPGQANNSGAVNGYDAYFGSYELDPVLGTVAVRLEAGLPSPGR
jgi:hypothetical protein